MIKHTIFCDHVGCEASAPSGGDRPSIPEDWAALTFSGRTEKNEDTLVESHLCPAHAEAVGKLFRRQWSVQAEMVGKAPRRFAP